MNKFDVSAIALAIGLAFGTGAMANSLSKEEYKAQKEGISAEYRSDKAVCGSFAANAKEYICNAEAEGKEKVANAALEALYRPTPQTRYDARVAKADAAFAVAKERCDDHGNAKDACVKEAKAARTTARADAKAQFGKS